jgi:hypothetical protein
MPSESTPAPKISTPSSNEGRERTYSGWLAAMSRAADPSEEMRGKIAV